jgi:hypothetical protein
VREEAKQAAAASENHNRYTNPPAPLRAHAPSTTRFYVSRNEVVVVVSLFVSPGPGKVTGDREDLIVKSVDA